MSIDYLNDINLIIQQGKNADRHDDYDKAVTLFSKVTNISGGEFLGNYHTAWTHLTYGRGDLAIGFFEKALISAPLSLMANLGLAHSLYEMNDFARAMQHYGIALRKPNWLRLFLKCDNGSYMPLPYAAYSISSWINNVTNVVFCNGILDIPHLYFSKISLKRRPSSFYKRLAKAMYSFCLNFMPMTNNYCEFLSTSSYSNPAEPIDNEPSYGLFKDIKDKFSEEVGYACFDNIDTIIHERFCHAFDFIIHELIFGNRQTYSEYTKRFFNLASMACSEGFAYWVQVNGVDFHNSRRPNNKLLDNSAILMKSFQDDNLYKIGFEAFEKIRNRYNIQHALLLYFIAFDLPEIIPTRLSSSDSRNFFLQPRNNPNKRLQLLSDMDLEPNLNVFQFAEKAQIELKRNLTTLPRCSNIRGV